ncbi:MAG: 3-deoxy-D-manno-octulosonic acid transferase [Halothiobacillus sp.]
MTAWMYSFLLFILFPWLMLDSLRRFFRAPKHQRVLFAQFGRLPADVPSGGIWLHAVSLGEVRAAAALITALQRRWPNLPLVVSTTTETGANAARELGVPHFYAPFDYAFAQRAALHRLLPRLMIVMETELWPNLIRLSAQMNVPVAVVNARLSDQSSGRYQRWGGALLRETLARLTLICAQSAVDRNRFVALAPPVMTVQILDCGNVKFDLAERAVAPWSVGARPVWLAASTHEGEEALLLEAHWALLALHPQALLVLAPRHPERASAVRALIAARGLVAQQFSHTRSGGAVEVATQVLLIDQTGQLMRFFSAIAVIFMGGSLVRTGGHNPIEPALFRRAVLSGPRVRNFRAVYRELAANDAVHFVGDAVDVATAVQSAWAQPTHWSAMGARAYAVVQANRGATQRIVDALAPILDDVRVVSSTKLKSNEKDGDAG